MSLNPFNSSDWPVRRQGYLPTPSGQSVDTTLAASGSDSRPSTPTVVDDIEAAFRTVPGDQSREDLTILATITHASAALPGHIVTIGAGQGRAAAVLGQAARAAGRSRVFAVDIFPDGEEAPDDIASSLDAFLDTMTRCNLVEHVLPHHGTAATFAQLMLESFKCRLLLLESAHACSNVATDVFVLERFLVPGGWLCIDQMFSSFPGATTAIDTLFRQRNHFDLARQITPGLFVARKRG